MKMKMKNVLALLCAAIFTACNSEANDGLIKLTNPVKMDRKDELIVLSRKVLEEKTGPIPAGKFVRLLHNKQPLPVQYDDLDGDGSWDEVAVLLSFNAAEVKELSLELSDTPAAIKAVVRAYVRHKRKNNDNTFGPDLEKDSIPAGQQPTDFSKMPLPPFLTEGPAWENDKVGFRVYADSRNGKDIWGKRTADMVLETVGVDPKLNYHRLSDWGMDILRLGNSLAAGSLAITYKTAAGADTLVRVGGAALGPVIYKRIANGPIRAIFSITFPEWNFASGQEPARITETIQIWGGQYFYENHVTASGLPEGASLAVGVVNLLSKKYEEVKEKNVTAIYTYDKQSENEDLLGMGIAIKDNFKGVITAPAAGKGVTNTYAVNTGSRAAVIYRFYAGWELSDDRFKTASGFRTYVQEDIAKQANPINIK